MRSKNSYVDFYFLKRSMTFALLAIAFGIIHSDYAQAKTDKYKRPSSATNTDSSGTPGPAPKDAPSSGTGPATPPNPDKKVDISDLENRYWTAKDTEFNVVQNRVYTKAKRFSLTLQGGTNLSDQYTTNFNLGLTLNYYFTERNGVEVQYWKTLASNADFVTAFAAQNNIMPDHNIPQSYMGVSYNWIPIYAKLSLLEKKILYFDMAISPGVGVTYLKADTFASPPTFTAPTANTTAPLTFALDITQEVFIDEHWALRLDLRNHLFNETIYSAGGTIGGQQTRQKTTYNGIIMFGVTYFH